MAKKCDRCGGVDATYQVCDNCKNSKYVDNSVLTYISTYINRSSMIQMKLAILGYFSENAIQEAKKTLFDAVEKLGICPKNVNRQNTATRSAKEAEIEDIMGVFTKLDTADSSQVPIFCTSDVSTLPPTRPEEGGSIMSVLEVVSKMQRELQQLRDTVVRIQGNVDDHENRLGSTAAAQSKLMRNISAESHTAHKARSGSPYRRPVDEVMLTDALQKVSESSYAGAAASGLARHPLMDNEGFIQIGGPNGDKRVLKGFNGQKKERPKQKGTAGTAGSVDNLKAGPQKIHVQLTNVHPDTDEEAITTYIRDKDNTIAPTDLQDTSSEGWTTKRFLVTFPATAEDKVLSSDFWPSKIYYKKWFAPRPKWKQDNTNQTK